MATREQVGPGAHPRASLAVICALLLTVPGVGRCASGGKDPTAQLSKLQSVMFAYADKYMSAIAEVTTLFVQRNPTDPVLRLHMHTLKLVVGSSVQELAVKPNPESTLLDMMVFAALHRKVFEGKAGAVYYGEAAAELAKTSRVLEKEIWGIANGYLTAQQIAEVDQLIQDWWAANPGLIVVSYIRFNDFASLRSESPLVAQASHSGFLVDISGAEQKVNEALLLAERALHYSQRFPWIMEWQIEKVFFQIAVEPEFRVSLEQTQSMTRSLDRYADSLDKLPKLVHAERSASIHQLAQAIATEREAFFAGLDARQEMLQGALGGVQASLADADKLAIDLQKTTSTINEALINADKLVGRFDTGSEPDSAPSKPFDINVYVNAIQQLTVALREANTLVLTTAKATGGNGAMSGIFSGALWTGSILILILCVAVFITMLIYRAAARHIVPRSSFEYVGPPPESVKPPYAEEPAGKT